MPAEQVTRARKYAYHFFFRRMVPVPAGADQARAAVQVEHRTPGRPATRRHPGLDVICDGILNGTPFIYPAETLGVHDA